MTGSGRSVRKTGRRAPSVRSGCCSSDCFLETHTYIYRHRKGKKEEVGRLAFHIPTPHTKKKLARIR